MTPGGEEKHPFPLRFYRMDPMYRAGWILLRALFRIWFRLRVVGLENVPKTGGAILASNHASYLDPPLIGAALHRPVAYLARKSLFRFKPFAWLITRLNAVPVDRDGASASGLRTVLELLEAGIAIVMFPEGTRSPNGSLLQARPGIGLVALHTNAPVIPIRITGSFKALPRGGLFPKPVRISITFGPAVDLRDLREKALNARGDAFKALCHEAAARIMKAISRL